MSITRYSPAATRRSPLELLLEPPMESEMLFEDAEPALDADEARLSARTGRAQVVASAARHKARGRREEDMRFLFTQIE
jgi:hypothetical protein